MISEPAIPACSCLDCRYPTGANVEVRLLHADRHAEFAAWLAQRPAPRPSIRARVQRAAEEWREAVTA